MRSMILDLTDSTGLVDNDKVCHLVNMDKLILLKPSDDYYEINNGAISNIISYIENGVSRISKLVVYMDKVVGCLVWQANILLALKTLDIDIVYVSRNKQ